MDILNTPRARFTNSLRLTNPQTTGFAKDTIVAFHTIIAFLGVLPFFYT